jgi:hypothetical protein
MGNGLAENCGGGWGTRGVRNFAKLWPKAALLGWFFLGKML